MCLWPIDYRRPTSRPTAQPTGQPTSRPEAHEKEHGEAHHMLLGEPAIAGLVIGFIIAVGCAIGIYSYKKKVAAHAKELLLKEAEDSGMNEDVHNPVSDGHH